MAPRPEFALMDQYNGGLNAAAAIKSPTPIINSIRPRPRSPRHPRALDHRGKPLTPDSPERRRRSHEEMGKFVNDDAVLDIPHKGPRIVGDLLSFNQNVLTCAGASQDSSSIASIDNAIDNSMKTRNRPTAKRNFGICLDHTAAAAGDFVVTAAEIYRQECRSDNRGRERTLATQRQRLLSGSRRGSLKGKEKERDEHSIVEGRSLSDEERREYSDDNKRGEQQYPKEPSGTPPSRYPSGDASSAFSPPAVQRSSDRNAAFDPKPDNGDLMEARMELFRLGQETIPQSEVRLARALQDLKRQDKVIDGWKRQLEMTQQHLDETFKELEKIKKESHEKQFKATEIRAKAVQDRKKLQDMYDKEVDQRKKLQDDVTKLQREVSSLKVALRNARNSNGVISSPPRGTPAKGESTGQIMALKAEIVDLRSQLAEAHAVNIDDHSTLHSVGEIDELRRKLRKAEAELVELRTKDLDLDRIEEGHRAAMKTLQEKMERLEAEANEARSKLEENLKAAVEEENEARAELAKVKANVQRLERERSRQRLHSSADVERLTKQLAKAKEETALLREQLESEQKAKKEETEKLRMELSEVKEKYVASTKEFADKTTAHLEIRRTMQEELEALQKEVQELKKQLDDKTEELTSQAKLVTELQSSPRSQGSMDSITASRSTDPITASREMSELKDEVKALKATELSLRAEICRQQADFARERADNAKAAASMRKTKSADDADELEKFKNQVEALQEAEKKRVEEGDLSDKLRKEVVVLEKKVEFLQRKLKTTQESTDDDVKVKAMEQSLKNEITILKAKLSESEAKCTEERFRAEEERRISKENEARHSRELDDLRQEIESSASDRLKLREELEELRKQLASGIADAGKKASEKEVPGKVMKLRSELALARARLAAAREQTTNTFAPSSSLHSPSPSLETMETPSLSFPESVTDRLSTASVGSSWAPPRKNAHALSAPSSSNGVSDFDEDGESRDEAEPTEKIQVKSPRGALSFGQTSLIDADASEEVFPEDTVLIDKYAPGVEESKRTGKARVDAGVEELRRQLEESSKRLEKANTRLNGLADATGMINVKAVPLPPYRGINSQMISTLSDEEGEENDENEGGFSVESSGVSVMEEVVTVTSEAGDIEVQRIRFADL